MVNQIIQRLVRIARFDMSVYEEIEHDENANVEAAVVVLVAAFLSALGAAVGGAGFGGFVSRFLVGVLLNWLLWSYVTMFIGTRLFGGEASFWEMARTLGYANAPAALGILGAIACIGWLIGIAAWVLSLVIGFFAVREALDLPTDKAIITIVIGWVVMLVVNILTGMLFAGAGALL